MKALGSHQTEQTASDLEQEAQELMSAIVEAGETGLSEKTIYELLLKLSKNSSLSRDEHRETQLRLAELLLTKQPWRARAHVLRAAAIEPCERSWALLGLIAAQLGAKTQACAAFRAAYSLNPNEVSHAHNYGYWLFQSGGDPVHAERLIVLALTLAKNSLERAEIGDSLAQIRRLGAASLNNSKKS